MELTFVNFWQDIISNPMLFITVLLTLGVIFVNGWTDAPNAIATCVATRCMPVRAAIMMSAVFNFLGVVVRCDMQYSSLIFRNSDQRKSQSDCRAFRSRDRNSAGRGRNQL